MAQYAYPTLAQVEMVNLLKVPYATGIIHLTSSIFVPGPNTTLADLTAIEATFTGYSPVTLTAIPAAYIDPINGGISQAIPLAEFSTASPYTVGNTVYGGFITDAAGPNLLACWNVPAGWNMTGADQSLPLQLVFNFFGTGAVYVSYGNIPQ